MLSPEQQKMLDALLQSANNEQKIWIAGYLAGISSQAAPIQTSGALHSSETNQLPLRILYGSHSGNSESIAEMLAGKFKSRGASVEIQDMGDYKPRSLSKEKNLIVIVSTHGEGEPPLAAEEFHSYLFGERAPKLDNLNYAVCALGDSSYKYFCKTGADIDERLVELGAIKILDRVDCDLDYEDKAEEWADQVIKHFEEHLHGSGLTKVTANQPNLKSQYSKKQPFPAQVLEKVMLSGRGSRKENYHLELSLEGSGLKYEPGDALGVLPRNSEALVDKILELKAFDPATVVQNGFGSKSIREALIQNLELTVLTREVVNNYAKLSKNAKLNKLIEDEPSLFKYLFGHDVIDLLEDFPADFGPEELVNMLRKLQPRLYSIASSPAAFPDEVHLTVGALRYKTKNRLRNGVCSGFIADNLDLDDRLPVYIDKNKNFRLPSDSNRDIIMIGPGTGIAPFRAFLQHREAIGAKGKNWLFFGDQHFTTDFLYQTEIQKWHKKGILSRIDLAFSRDQANKVYVQHRLQYQAKEIYKWIQDGASLYVCGDADRMAHDVEDALSKIVEQESGSDAERAAEFIKNLKREKRYLADVY